MCSFHFNTKTTTATTTTKGSAKQPAIKNYHQQLQQDA
jgi:hypothetical protein